MDKVEIKQIGAVLEIKDEEKGEVEAVFATLGVMDKDGDIIREGAIKNGTKVKMSSYGHDAIFGAVPVGKGTVHVEGDQALFKGRLFLSTVRGKETFDVLKEFGADQEWSFGFRVTGSEVPDEAQRQKGVWRVITKMDVFEVSPVLRGAGVGTHTVAVKEADAAAEPDPEAKAAEEAARLEAETKAEEERIAAEKMEAEAKEAASLAAAELKARVELEVGEFHRVQRTLKRMGVV